MVADAYSCVAANTSMRRPDPGVRTGRYDGHRMAIGGPTERRSFQGLTDPPTTPRCFGWRKKPRLVHYRRGFLDCFFCLRRSRYRPGNPESVGLFTDQPFDQSPLGKRPNALGYHRGPDLPARVFPKRATSVLMRRL